MPIALPKERYAKTANAFTNALQMLKRNAMEMQYTGTTAATAKAHYTMTAPKMLSGKNATMHNAAFQEAYSATRLQDRARMPALRERKDARVIT